MVNYVHYKLKMIFQDKEGQCGLVVLITTYCIESPQFKPAISYILFNKS